MATLSVLKFDTPFGAEGGLELVKSLEKQHLITLQDAAIVTWSESAKKPKTKQLINLAGIGALNGAFWGMLFGLIFFVPLLGLAVGAAFGALGASMADVGIDDEFIKKTKEKVNVYSCELLTYRELVNPDGPAGQRRRNTQLVQAARAEQLDAIALALRVQHLADVPARFRLDQRHVERDQLVVIAVEAPVQDPRRLDRERRGRAVVAAAKLADELGCLHRAQGERQQCQRREAFLCSCHRGSWRYLFSCQPYMGPRRAAIVYTGFRAVSSRRTRSETASGGRDDRGRRSAQHVITARSVIFETCSPRSGGTAIVVCHSR